MERHTNPPPSRHPPSHTAGTAGIAWRASRLADLTARAAEAGLGAAASDDAAALLARAAQLTGALDRLHEDQQVRVGGGGTKRGGGRPF